MIQLKISRQYLDDICAHFMPYMLRLLEARIAMYRNTEAELVEQVCMSVLEDLDLMLQRKTLTTQHNFKIKLKKSEAIILMQLMLKFPIMENEFWRMNLRNNIVEQLHKQLV